MQWPLYTASTFIPLPHRRSARCPARRRTSPGPKLIIHTALRLDEQQGPIAVARRPQLTSATHAPTAVRRPNRHRRHAAGKRVTERASPSWARRTAAPMHCAPRTRPGSRLPPSPDRERRGRTRRDTRRRRVSLPRPPRCRPRTRVRRCARRPPRYNRAALRRSPLRGCTGGTPHRHRSCAAR